MTEFEPIESRPEKILSNRYAQLSHCLKWLSERAWPLSIGILLTAGVYLYQYILEEKIPLSITSSAVITALPVMSAILVFVISVLLAFVLLPIFVLFHRLNSSEKRLSDDFSFDHKCPQSKSRHLRLLGRWGGGLLILGIFCALLSGIGSQVQGNLLWGAGAVLGTVLTLAAYYWLMTLGVDGPISTEFRFACVMSAFVQLGVILNVTIVVINIASQYVSSVLWLVPLMLGELLLVWLIQLLGAQLVVKVRGHENPVALLAIAVIAVVIGLGLYPPSGAKLGGFAFQISASGARHCTIMSFDAERKGFESIVDPDRPGLSRPLRIIAEADGTYFVRPWKTESKAVQFVPRASLTGIDACPGAREMSKNAQTDSSSA
ncbi:hypothetical protein [Pseudomonas sp. P8_241]|uniref:hypothetical protein n=1 Tax=Pseudomonas sp. P8_241 TaxID=3043445 RepID=UPI002A35A623|nr:hypothetical protein [Pseudomonas sp. P8_241]WPN49193.1 hypothetical protein QMK58_11255 [Pseudomonas sp. P8_241]